MIEVTFLKELMSVRQANQKSLIFFTTGVFQITGLIFNHNFAMDAMIYGIINIKGADYRCIINGIRKSEAIKLMQNIDLTEKRKTI